MMTLSIVSHRQASLVATLLRDLARIHSPLVAAIVLTRNVDEDAFVVPDELKERTRVIVNAQPHGFGANHNAAFALCSTPFFVVLNPDIRIDIDPFCALLARLEAATPTTRHAVALVAPRIVAPDGRDEDAARKLITPWRLFAHRVLARDRRAASDFDWLAGMFLATRSAAFREVGGFDERYFMYCEDFDLCARLRLAGWAIALADTVSVVHDAQRASHRSTKHLLWHVTSLLKMWTSATFWRYRQALSGPLR